MRRKKEDGEDGTCLEVGLQMGLEASRKVKGLFPLDCLHISVSLTIPRSLLAMGRQNSLVDSSEYSNSVMMVLQHRFPGMEMLNQG